MRPQVFISSKCEQITFRVCPRFSKLTAEVVHLKEVSVNACVIMSLTLRHCPDMINRWGVRGRVQRSPTTQFSGEIFWVKSLNWILPLFIVYTSPGSANSID